MVLIRPFTYYLQTHNQVLWSMETISSSLTLRRCICQSLAFKILLTSIDLTCSVASLSMMLIWAKLVVAVFHRSTLSWCQLQTTLLIHFNIVTPIIWETLIICAQNLTSNKPTDMLSILQRTSATPLTLKESTLTVIEVVSARKILTTSVLLTPMVKETNTESTLIILSM